MELHADVAVIGLGAMGASALWRLALRGARAIGFEQYELGHDRGSSHGESRIIRSAYFEGAQYVPLVQRAFPMWRDLEARSSASLLALTGALMIGSPESALVQGTLASAREHDLAHEILDADEMRRRYPQHRLHAGEVGVYEAAAGVLRPEAAIAAMLAQAGASGARVLRRTAVTRITPDGSSMRVEAGGTEYRVRHAIVAVGPWLASFLPELPLPLTVTRQVMAWFRPREAARFAPDRFPVFVRELPGNHSRYGVPSLDDETVKVGVHYEGAVTDPERVDRRVQARDLEPILAFVDSYLPDLEPAALRSQVCLYTNTSDTHFVIDAPPGLPRATVLSCCSGHGFKFAPVIGEAAADLALEGRTGYPIESFGLARFAVRTEPQTGR